MAQQKLMKEGLSRPAVVRIGSALQKSSATFNGKNFVKHGCKGLAALELKQRVQHLIAVLHQYLPSDFRVAAPILLRVKEYWDPGDVRNALSSFAAWPIIDYVSVYGLQHPQLSLRVLKQLTTLFSAEFAIRPFIIQHPELTFKQLHHWCKHADPQVRRLVSEGTRPRLPWGQRLPAFCKDPEPVLKLLERLKDDPSDYVRRSVANNLNDIGKDHPDTVLTVCRQWSSNASLERQWIIRHATRSLVKAGHPKVFALLGYTRRPKIVVSALRINKKKLRLGEALTWTTSITSQIDRVQHLVVDYAIHHVKSNGSLAAKVFKGRTIQLQGQQSVEISKSHSFKEITTRKYYAGTHTLELLINGRSIESVCFTLALA